MEQENNNGKKGWFSGWSFWSFVKAFFIFIIFINVLPMFLGGFRENIQSLGQKRTLVSMIEIGGGAQGSPFDGMITSNDPYSSQINKAANDDSIKAIVLKIDSPGGVPAPCELIARDVARARAKKPVIAVVEHICASGSYWVASGCNKIICPETALIGSIGVISQSFNFRGLAERFDVKSTVVKAGKYKTIGHPFEKPNEGFEIEYRQDLAKQIYKIFASDVAKNRGLSTKEVSVWADGKIFTGQKAFELGLVDEIGGLPEAEEVLYEMFGREAKLFYVKAPKPSPLAKLLGSDQSTFFGVAAQLACVMTTAVCQTFKQIMTSSTF